MYSICMKGTRVPQPILLRRSTVSARDAPPIGGMQTVSRLGFPCLVQQSRSMVPFRSPECPTPAWNSTEGAPEKTRPDRPMNAACRSATTGIHDAVPADGIRAGCRPARLPCARCRDGTGAWRRRRRSSRPGRTRRCGRNRCCARARRPGLPPRAAARPRPDP